MCLTNKMTVIRSTGSVFPPNWRQAGKCEEKRDAVLCTLHIFQFQYRSMGWGGGSGRLFCMQRPGVNHSYHPVSRLWAHQKRHQWFSSGGYHLSTSTLVSLTSWCCFLRRDPPAAFINILLPLRCAHFHLRINRLCGLTSFITSLASQQSHQSPPPVSPLYWVGGVISPLLGAHAPTIIKFPFGVEALKHFWQDLIITSSGVKSKYLDCILLPLPWLWIINCCGTTVR